MARELRLRQFHTLVKTITISACFVPLLSLSSGQAAGRMYISTLCLQLGEVSGLVDFDEDADSKMPRNKRPSPVFEVLFEGEEVYPEFIPLGTLTQTFSAIRRLMAGSEVVEEDEEAVEVMDTSSIRLLDVKRGSALFQFVGASATTDLANLRGVGRVLESPDELGNNDYVLRPIETLSAVARRLECSVVFREATSQKTILAKIEPTSYERIAGSLFITGDTAITGRVERVGGATAKSCALRVSFQAKLLYCKVTTQDIARQLGAKLYQDVAVTGTVRWLRSSWKIVHFTINNVYQPQTGSLQDAFQALREAGGHGWDGVQDPRAFIEEISGQ